MQKIDAIYSDSKTPLRFFEFEGSKHRISYFSTPENGPALLLLHGANIGKIQWYKIIDTLAQNHTVYAIDLPGSGNSSELSYLDANLDEDYVLPVVEFVDTIIGDRQFDIIGHSFGGWVGLKLTLQKPFAGKLLLVNSLGFTRKLKPQFFPLSFALTAKLLMKYVVKMQKKDMEYFLKSVLHKPEVVEDKFIEAFYENVYPKRHPFLFMKRILSPFRISNELDLTYALPSLTSDIHFLLSEYDPFISRSELQKKVKGVPNLFMTYLNKTGHAPMIEAPDEFASICLKCL